MFSFPGDLLTANHFCEGTETRVGSRVEYLNSQLLLSLFFLEDFLLLAFSLDG